MSDRYDQLLPPSLTATIGSMPRRWKEALYLPPPKSIDDVFTEADPNGICVAEEAGAMLAMLAVLEPAIRTTSYNDPELLTTEVQAAVKNDGAGPWPSSAKDALQSIEERFESLIDLVNSLNPRDWTKSASIKSPTGPSVSGRLTMTELIQGASRVSAERLARAEKAVASFR